MPTGIGNGIAGDVFQNNLGAGGGGGLVCPSRYSLLFNGTTQFSYGSTFDVSASASSLSVWINTSDRAGVSATGTGIYSSSASGIRPFSTYFDAEGVLNSKLGPMTFPAHPELITNGSFSNVPVGTELIANPTFSDAASITPWNTSSGRATIGPWEPRFMRLTYDLAQGGALFDNLSQPLNTMYSVKMRVRGVTSAGADQGSAFSNIGDNVALTSANIISNPTLTYDYQDYEFRVWSTTAEFRLYLASAAIGDVVDFDSISVKPLDMVVDNGNFSSLGADWTVIDNAAGDTVTFGGSSATWTKTVPEAVYLQQDYPVTLGASHKLTYTVLSNTFTGSGTELGLSSVSAYGQSTIPSSVGTHTVYLIVTLDTPVAALRFYSNDTGGSLEITDVSVEELGEDWTVLEDTCTFGENGVTMTSTEGTDLRIRTGAILADTTSYKVTYTIHAVGLTGTNAIQYYTGSALNAYDDLPEQGIGTHTFYYTTPSSTNNNWYFKLDLRDGSTSTTDFVTISSVSIEEVLSEDEWHHIALSIDRDSEWKWYVDGVLTNTMDNSTDAVPDFAGFIGFTLPSSSIIGLNDWFNGYMTEPSLWNTALSTSSVKAIYDNMYGGQRCLGTLPFTSDLITNGNFTQIGPELVSNPNFTDTGSDVIYNGGFDTSIALGTTGSGWVNPDAAAAYNLGGCKITRGAAGFARLRGADILGNDDIISLSTNYKITYTVLENNGAASVIFELAGTASDDIPLSLTTHTVYVTSGTSASQRFQVYNQTASSNITLTDILVEELGEDWSIGMSDGSAQTATKYAEILASGCRIVSDDTATPYIGVQQDVVEIGKNYKGSVSVTNSDTGKIRANFGGVNSDSFIDGSNTFYASETSSISVTFLRNATDVDTTFTHVSVKEVGQGWEAEGTGSGVVTFPNGMARIETVAAPNSAYIRQYSVMEVGKSYTMTYRIVSNNGGTLYNSGQTPTTMDSTVGSHSETFIAGSSNLLISRSGNNTDISITNITLTQVGGGNLERWWRMNGTDDSSYIVANQAPNGTVNDLAFANSPQIEPEVP